MKVEGRGQRTEDADIGVTCAVRRRYHVVSTALIEIRYLPSQ